MTTTIEQPDFDSEAVQSELLDMSIDRVVIDQIIGSYLEELDQTKPEQAALFRSQLSSDDGFAEAAQRAAMEAVVFSTLANGVEDNVYEASLSTLSRLDDDELQRMRFRMFEFGLTVSADHVGGSNLSGRLKNRQAMFESATAS